MFFIIALQSGELTLYCSYFMIVYRDYLIKIFYSTLISTLFVINYLKCLATSSCVLLIQKHDQDILELRYYLWCCLPFLSQVFEITPTLNYTILLTSLALQWR